MKKKKKFIIISIIVLVVILLVGGAFYFYLRDENKLTTTEKRYLADNATIIQNVNVINNVNVFGNAGVGVYYDFISDFSSEYGIDTNNVAYNLGDSVSGISFGLGNTLGDNEISFYKDHYVLVSKNYEFISDFNLLSDLKIGILGDNISYVSNYLTNENKLSFTTYATDEELLTAFNEQSEINYIIVPLNLYLDQILANNYSVVYHFSDIPYYYKIYIGENNTLGSIINKYFNTWSEKYFDEYYKDHLFNLFINSLNISLTEVDAMRSISYNYGFVENCPYEILSGGNYGGIIAQYLKDFNDFSDIDLKFTKYKNIKQFEKAINNNKINLYFGYYNLQNNLTSIHSGIDIAYSVLVPRDDALVVNSLESLSDSEVYVLENSSLYNYLVSNKDLNLKTYSSIKELKKIVNKGKIVIVDKNVALAYNQEIFGNYSIRYSNTFNNDYVFKISANETFNKLFEKFINIKDSKEVINKGIYNYDMTLRSGTITATIAKYFMYVLIIFVLVFLYVYRVAKRVKISKKIKKEDKLKYIDQLTSLKNRNYLSENLDSWGKNTIYPQAVIVIDLNNLQNINDTMGYEQGDIQIKAAANVLVKTQLDNSDIIRTDGNEFVIYLIGYQMKQITSYIHKLNKEFKKLPYEYGAAIGYSMIEDKLKSIEDAINEAVEDVKKQKENKKEV
jgi:diguanylate cyclase (GGDEF)-like protein